MYTKFGEDVGPYGRYIYLYILTPCTIREGYVKCMSELFVPHLRPSQIIICLTGRRSAVSEVPVYTVFQKKTPTHIIGYMLRSCCLILIIDTNIPYKI